MAGENGIKILKYYSQKLKNFFFSKEILSFLLFLALSAGFWFVHALGKERETIISLPVRYIGLPMSIAITNNPPEKIKIIVKDQGLRLLDYSRHPLTPMTIDLSGKFYQKGEILITPDQLSGQLSRYMHKQPTTNILEVTPDSILIRYQKLKSKKLPIRLLSKIELKSQYMLSRPIVPEPNFVTVFGVPKIVDSLNCVYTEILRYHDLSDTLHAIAALQPHPKVRYAFNKVKVDIMVEPFTERKVQIPVTFVNCPPQLSIRTFPTFVTATYTVGISNFNNLGNNDIMVYLDYNDLKSNDQSKQILKIKNNTSHISNIRISPVEVEFILEQK